ncbi:MAG TPA: alpha/beta fold hydrolase [Bacteroidales bacterium]|nr:alpha/beta fold hydrolase [Bacteroidales bacterium]
MKIAIKTITAIWLSLATLSTMGSATPLLPETLERKSLSFVESLRAGTAGEDMEIFSDQMRAALQGFSLAQLWQQLEGQLGPFEAVNRFVHQPGERFYIILVVTRFLNGEIALRLVFDKDEKIAGLQVVEAPPVSFTAPPSYADPKKFTETEVLIPCGDIYLPAKMTMPVARDSVPLVVLVHGSGPHDMDQTIGPNKPFRDIAWGLATQGIAVIRYEKRTKNHSEHLDLNTLTPWKETGADAVMAVRFAANQSGIDPNRIFVLGHSLGGMMAPKIAHKAGNLAGIIIMGGNSGKLYDLVIRQLIHLAPIQDPDNRHGMRELIEDAKNKASIIRDGNLALNTPRNETLLNLPPSYWLYIKDYDQVATAAGLKISVLILQGERDYQVDMQEFKGWKAALGNKNNVRFICYPALNHLFFAGQGAPGPSEYNLPNNVDVKVIQDIARWVLEW